MGANLILLGIAIFIAYKFYTQVIKVGCKCEKCGKNIKCDEEFCPYCGAHNTAKEAYVDNSTKNNDTKNTKADDFDYTPPKTEKKYYNYYEVLDDLDGVIVSLMAKVAKSNDVISKDEAEYISKRYLELARLTNKSADVIDVYEDIFEKEKNNFENIQEIASKLKDLNEPAKAYVMKILEELSSVDGDYKILDKIKQALRFEEKQNNSYYEVLNSKPTDDWETIKKNYKELVKEYHYDKLASKNLPQDLLDYAQNKLKEINEAYEALKKLKNV